MDLEALKREDEKHQRLLDHLRDRGATERLLAPLTIDELREAAVASLDEAESDDKYDDLTSDIDNVRHLYTPSEPLTFATVFIGRNIGNDGDERLGSREWDEFRQAVSDLFDDSHPQRFVVTGLSASNEHGAEESYIVGGHLLASPDYVRTRLAQLARRYEQTAIAFVIGGERITPS